MIDYISLPVSDLAHSQTFYQTVLAPLGYRLLASFHEFNEQRDSIAGFGLDHTPDLWLCHVQWAPQAAHIALRAATLDDVDLVYRLALTAGGRSERPPGLRLRFHSSHYQACFLDPDGHTVEVSVPQFG